MEIVLSLETIKEALSDECELSISHLEVHLKSAKEALLSQDKDQFLHNINIVGVIGLGLYLEGINKNGD